MENTYETKCVMIGRKPRVNENQFKTLTIGMYAVNDPHKSGDFPAESLDLPNIESLDIVGLRLSYYLEGNDILINNLKSVKIVVDGNKAILSGEQEGV